MFFLVGCDSLPTNVTVSSGLTTIEEEPTSMVTTENVTEAPTTVEPITTVDGTTQTQAPTDEPTTSSGITSRVYFYNSEGWASVYAYTWNDEEEETLGPWPGNEMTQDGTSNWFSIDVPLDTSQTSVSVVFNNNNNGLQTQDFFINDSTNVYFVPSNGGFADKTTAESSLESTTRLYFYNPASLGWTATAHLWEYNGNNPDLNTNWPGTVMTQLFVDDDNDPLTDDVATDWYYVDISTDTSEFKAIISNNGSPQTNNITIYSYDEIFLTLGDIDGNYNVNRYLSMSLAEESLSSE